MSEPEVNLFHEQVKRGDLAAVRTALEEHPALLDQTNDAGQSAFLLAKYYRQETVAEYLLGLNPKLDVYVAAAAGLKNYVLEQLDEDPALLVAHSSDGWTPLHLAVFFGHHELATALLDRGAPVEIRSTNGMKNTPLHAAIAGGKLESARVLLSQGADANATQEGGWTPLHGAAQNGDYQLVELLLANGADPNARAGNNQSAVDLAMSKGHADVVELLEALSGKQP